jgi:UDP-glucose 4-epimerase
MIFLSSGGTVYGNQEIQPIVEDALPRPINHYGNVKLCIENTIRTFNYQAHTKILIARISNPYGQGQDFNKGVGFIDAAIKKTIRGEKIEIWGDGNNVRDYIYIDDVCRMLISLFNYQGKYDTFNISSNTGTSQRDIIRMLEEMHLAPEVVYLPARSVDAKKIILNNERIMSIHEVPLVPIVQGIEYYYQWLKKEI